MTLPPDDQTPPAPRPTSSWAAAAALVTIVLLWLVGIGSALMPIPLLSGSIISLTFSVVLWASIIAATVVVGLLLANRWIAAIGGIGSVLLCALLLNWVAVAPEAWFDVHRSQFEAAAQIDPLPAADDYYGELLPLHQRWLTVDGRVSAGRCFPDSCTDPEGALFFAQWAGFPDDAGGYIYLPTGRPEGIDMWSMACTEPTDLGGGWWMCGMG